jgi:hypothetical protein
MVATVVPWDDLPIALSGSSSSTDSDRPTPPAHFRGVATFRRTGLPLTTGAILCLVVGISAWAFLFHGKTATNKPAGLTAVVSPPQQSVAVLPFLDLTEGMKDGEFADGMTEELITDSASCPACSCHPLLPRSTSRTNSYPSPISPGRSTSFMSSTEAYERRARGCGSLRGWFVLATGTSSGPEHTIGR